MPSRMINLRLDERMIKQIDEVIEESESTYSTRTEFMREAIRQILEKKKTERLIKMVEKNRGAGLKILGRTITDEEIEEAKLKVSAKMLKELEEEEKNLN
ncbi:ribbon-helix-helix domain-containing protein [Candidatus Undinarchaeota archaeon]